MAGGAAVALLNGALHSKETMRKVAKVDRVTDIKDSGGQMEGWVEKREVTERKEHTGISTGCIQPQAEVK